MKLSRRVTLLHFRFIRLQEIGLNFSTISSGNLLNYVWPKPQRPQEALGMAMSISLFFCTNVAHILFRSLCPFSRFNFIDEWVNTIQLFQVPLISLIHSHIWPFTFNRDITHSGLCLLTHARISPDENMSREEIWDHNKACTSL